MPVSAATLGRLKTLIVETLNLDGVIAETIDDESPLFGEGLGLDSIDALELVVMMEKEFGFRIENTDALREAFYSVATLAAFINRRLEDSDAKRQQ
jgi:acyl carrier protein